MLNGGVTGTWEVSSLHYVDKLQFNWLCLFEKKPAKFLSQ